MKAKSLSKDKEIRVMHSIESLGYADYYMLDVDKMYNSKSIEYVKEVERFRYKLKTVEGKYKSITIKEI